MTPPSPPTGARLRANRLVLAAAMASIVALAGCGPRPANEPRAAAADSAAIVPVTAADVRALATRGDARVTLVNVWATWCQPCREEFPELLAAARAHESEGVRLALVSADFDDQAPMVRRFLAEQGWRDTAYLKAEGDQTFINGIHPDWGGALPATLVLDATGRVHAFWEGRADRARFEEAITRALADAGAETGGHP